MPYATLPSEAIERMSEVSGNAFKLFAYLCDRANEDTGECFPSLAKIAADCGWHKSHACQYRTALVEAKWITINGDRVTLQIWASRKSKRTKKTANPTPNPLPKRSRIVTKTVTPAITETVMIITETVTERDKNGNETLPKPSQIITETVIPLIYNKTKNEPIEQNQERNQERVADETPAALVLVAKKEHSNKSTDPFYLPFAAAYLELYGVPYRSKRGDFVQFAELRAELPDVVTEEKWGRAVANYFASTHISQHTFADLVVRFGTFHRGRINRFTHSVPGVGSSSDGLERFAQTPATAGNAQAARDWLAKGG